MIQTVPEEICGIQDTNGIIEITIVYECQNLPVPVVCISGQIEQQYELKFLTQVSLRPVLGICETCSISFECALLVLTSILPGVVTTAWLVKKRIGTIAG
jgi:hypothetical protein